MSIPAPVITVFFGVGQIPNAFTLDDEVKGLLDSADYLLAGDIGTEISGHGYDITVSRGRSRELDEFSAGTCSVNLHNHDRMFDPLYAGVPGHMDLPGVSGNYLSHPNVGTVVTGMQLVARIAPDDWTPAANQWVIARWLFGGTDLRYRFGINTAGGLKIMWSEDSTSTTGNVDSTVAVDAVNGDWKWVSVTFNLLGGDNTQQRFWTSDDGVAWDQLGDTITTTTGIIVTDSAPLEFGGSVGGTSGMFAGKIADIGIDESKGVDFTGQFDPDITWWLQSADYPDGGTTIDSQASVFTLNTSGGTPAVFVPATAPLYGELVPGKHVTVDVHTQRVFTGIIEDWNLSWDVNGDAVAGFDAVDALATLGRCELSEFNATASQTPRQRLNAVLNRSEVGFGGNRSFETGQSVLQGDTVGDGTNALSYCQTVARSDAGRLFVDRSGVLTFLDRHHEIDATVAATFRDDGTGLPFHGIDVESGSALLYTRAAVERTGGTVQTADDTNAQERYGVRTLSLTGLLQDTDLQADNMAEYLLNVYKEPQTRISSVTVNVSGLADEDAAGVCGLDVGRLIRVVWTPPGGTDTVDQTLVIEGVQHQIPADGSHMVTFLTSRTTQFGQVFILDSADYGRLDVDPLGF